MKMFQVTFGLVALVVALVVGCAGAGNGGIEESAEASLYTSGERIEQVGSYNCAGWSASHQHNVMATLDLEPTTDLDPETGGVFWTLKVRPVVWNTPLNGVQPNMTVEGDSAGMRLRDYGGQGFWNIDDEIVWIRSYTSRFDYNPNDWDHSMLIHPFSVYVGPQLTSGPNYPLYRWGWVQWTMVFNPYVVNSTGAGQCKEPVSFLFAR